VRRRSYPSLAPEERDEAAADIPEHQRLNHGGPIPPHMQVGGVVRIAGNRARPVMPMRDPTHVAGALHRLRQRWFAPTRPLPVDDEPRWLPATDPGDSPDLDGDPEHAATTAAKP
jgi:hypothetical protein